MKLKEEVRKFQAGGPIPTEDPAMAAPAGPEMGGGEDPIVMIAQMMQQALETQDCETAFAACDAFLQFVEQMSGQGAPAGVPAEPTFKRGGRIPSRA